MKSTDWRKLPEIWKINLTVSLRFQEENFERGTIEGAFSHKNDCTPAEAYQYITQKSVDYPDWADTMFLNGLLHLRTLYCQHSEIEDLYPLMYFPVLEEIYIQHTSVDSLDGLILNNSVKVININHTYIDSINPLSSMSLIQFSAVDTDITELAPLRMMHELQSIDLRKTHPESLLMLAELEKLKELKLTKGNVDVKEVEAFAKSHPDCKLLEE